LSVAARCGAQTGSRLRADVTKIPARRHHRHDLVRYLVHHHVPNRIFRNLCNLSRANAGPFIVELIRRLRRFGCVARTPKIATVRASGRLAFLTRSGSVAFARA
jgi:hypothetical protein